MFSNMYKNEAVEPETRKGEGNRKKLRGTCRDRKVAVVSGNRREAPGRRVDGHVHKYPNGPHSSSSSCVSNTHLILTWCCLMTHTHIKDLG